MELSRVVILADHKFDVRSLEYKDGFSQLRAHRISVGKYYNIINYETIES